MSILYYYYNHECVANGDFEVVNCEYVDEAVLQRFLKEIKEKYKNLTAVSYLEAPSFCINHFGTELPPWR